MDLLIEKLKQDAELKKNWKARLIAKRILSLMEYVSKQDYIDDHFIFAHTVKVNIDLYKVFSDLTKEHIDSLEDVMERLTNPLQ